MNKVNYRFNEAEWGSPGIGLDYSSTPELQDEIKLLKSLYTEIAEWGDLSVFTAWGSFSQDQHDVKWQPVTERDEVFLGYLYHVEQTQGHFNWSDLDARRAVRKLHE